MPLPTLLDEKKKTLLNDIGLLSLRLTFGLTMAFAHGFGKVVKFKEGIMSEAGVQFSDPLGIGMTASMAGAVTSEFFCALAVAIGLFTRITVIPLIFTMLVAAFIIHAEDPFGTKEKALLFLFGYLAILLCGPGRFSADKLIFKS